MSHTWADKPTSIRKGEELDREKLEHFLNLHLPDWAGSLVIEQFPGGFSNLTYLLTLGEKELVLRRPPFGAKIKSAHDMGREYRILHALSPSYSKAPQPYVYTEDSSIIGAPFYIMERVAGVILRPDMPSAMYPDAETMRSIAHGLIDTLVELHEVDYQAAGLGELGRPQGYVERQIRGWTKRYVNAKTDEIPDIEFAAAWLASHMPSDSSASLIHNDFKYDNLVLDMKDWTQVRAVLDWEMSTLGDPLMDLGSALAYWTNASELGFSDRLDTSPTTIPGNPTRAEVAELYAQKSGRDLGELVFYYVYGIVKLAVISQQIYYRYNKGFTQDARFAAMIDAVKGLGNLAKRVIEKNRIDNLF
ncbi:MAG: phosphotransferase family protein [Bacteroidota bacterium]